MEWKVGDVGERDDTVRKEEKEGLNMGGGLRRGWVERGLGRKAGKCKGGPNETGSDSSATQDSWIAPSSDTTNREESQGKGEN